MNVMVEIDKVGRIVVPKKLRDSAGLSAGDHLDIELRGDEIVLRTKAKGKGLHKDRGVWAYDSGVESIADVNAWINDDRERRMRYVSGESLEP